MDLVVFIGTLLILLLALWAAAAFPLPGLRSEGLPPGPPALPLLGNLHLMPRSGFHLQLTRWAKAYGPVFSLKIGHGTMVVLTSAYHAVQLLDKRSQLYSNRPPSYILGKLVFGGDHPMFMDADDRWKLRRRLYFQLLHESRCNRDHVSLVEAEAAQLVRDMALDPASLMYHPGRFSNSIIMNLVFGIRTPRCDTPHYLALRRIMMEMSSLGEMGATPPVDVLSLLRLVPERLWGNWRTRAARLRESIVALHSPLVDGVVERRDRLGPSSSFLDEVLDQQDRLGLSRNEIDVMCGNLLEGGTDTMATTLLTLCQAMATHPEAQAEAQAQIDAVVGQRPPLWSNYDRLPLVAMVVKELLRWRPPGPSSFPHALAKDDEIDGMRIPKGAAVVLNVWGLHHDAARYANPDKFDPSRFRGQTELASVYANAADPEKRDHFGYGAGRRICPGIHLAERALFLAAASILWAFDIRPKVDEAGKPVAIDYGPATGYRGGFLNQCRPFEVDIRVRSERHREVIMAAAEKAEVQVFSAYS